MGKVSQSSFKGGIRQDIDPTKVPSIGNAYFLGINIRTSKDVIEPIKSPLDLTESTPSGKIQGVYGAKSYILLFVDGIPYFKNYADPNPEVGFRRLGTISLDPDVDYIYAEFVPGSTLGFARKRSPITNSDDTPISSDNIVLDLESDGLPYRSSIQGVIAQDGQNQPQLITDDGAVRELQDFGEWNTTDREFVPIGKFMLWTAGGILYSVDPDGLRIFHSVTGRPLDHVIAIDEEGNKLDSEDESLVAHAIDYEPITLLKPAPTENTIIACTKSKSYLVTELLAEEDLIFGEPSFSTIQVAAVGAVNHLCYADLGGDSGVINPNGIHSFNAASILKTESGNDPVSGPVSSLFALDEDHKVSQDYPCAKEFGADYSLFAVNTIYGRGVLVYDRTIQRFVSLDIYEGVEQIKQFADIVVNGVRRLFFVTVDNKFYEAFAGETYETAGIIPGEWSSESPSEEQKPLFCHLVFTECEAEGTVSVVPIVNRVHGSAKRETLKVTSSAPTLPITPPFGGGTVNTTQIVDINLATTQRGWKVGVWIQWNVKAKLTHVSIDTESAEQQVSSATRARRYTESAT